MVTTILVTFVKFANMWSVNLCIMKFDYDIYGIKEACRNINSLVATTYFTLYWCARGSAVLKQSLSQSSLN